MTFLADKRLWSNTFAGNSYPKVLGNRFIQNGHGQEANFYWKYWHNNSKESMEVYVHVCFCTYWNMAETHPAVDGLVRSSIWLKGSDIKKLLGHKQTLWIFEFSMFERKRMNHWNSKCTPSSCARGSHREGSSVLVSVTVISLRLTSLLTTPPPLSVVLLIWLWWKWRPRIWMPDLAGYQYPISTGALWISDYLFI